MKRYFTLSGLLVLLATVINAQSKDFRDFAWGTPFNKVKTTETAQLLLTVGDDELVYKDVLGGFDCNAYYIFNDNDKLESGMYVFTKKYSNPQLYLEDYDIFEKLIIQKYGQPVSQKENWSSRTLEIEKHNYGQAVADGNLTLSTAWITNRSDIKIELINSLEKVPTLQIQYTARSLDELQNKQVIQQAIKKL